MIALCRWQRSSCVKSLASTVHWPVLRWCGHAPTRKRHVDATVDLWRIWHARTENVPSLLYKVWTYLCVIVYASMSACMCVNSNVYGFRGWWIERRHFWLDQIQDGGQWTFWKNFKWPYLWNALSDSLYVCTQIILFPPTIYWLLTFSTYWRYTNMIIIGDWTLIS